MCTVQQTSFLLILWGMDTLLIYEYFSIVVVLPLFYIYEYTRKINGLYVHSTKYIIHNSNNVIWCHNEPIKLTHRFWTASYASLSLLSPLSHFSSHPLRRNHCANSTRFYLHTRTHTQGVHKIALQIPLSITELSSLVNDKKSVLLDGCSVQVVFYQL